MKKSRLSITLMATLLSAATLTGCDNEVKYSPSGTLITYTVGDYTRSITSQDIFAEYYTDSEKYQSIFEAIKSIVIKNYFTIEDEANGVPLGKAQLPELNDLAQSDVDGDKHQAETNARNNSTKYDKEFEKILKSKGVKTEQELFNKYLDQRKAEKFDENYYKYFLDEIKEGYKAPSTNAKPEETQLEQDKFWTGYFEDMLPYHVSHILVKLDDSSATNYYNGTISENDCEKLYLVVKTLENSNNDPLATFQKVASQHSEDDGSKAKSGDLGIMDYSTSYVNEFKLGVYAYESIYGKTESFKNSNIKIDDALESSFISESKDSYYHYTDIPSVDIKVFESLYDVRKDTKTEDEEDVMGGSSLVYPRNVIYNEYLNKHSFAFITGDTATESNFTKTNGIYDKGKTGLHKYTEAENPNLKDKIILSTVVANEIKPILMVRAGTSDYQGIHFIVANRDPFTETDKLGVKKSEYYTTANITDKNAFPFDEAGNPKATYANFSTNVEGDVNDIIKSFTSTIKGYDSDKLSKFIFKKYMAKEQIKIVDEKLNNALNEWIDNSVEKKADEQQDSWKKTWTDYVGTLRKQNSARNSLMAQAARLAFEDDIKLTDKLADIDLETLLAKYGYKPTEIQQIIADYVTNGNTENPDSDYVDKKPDGSAWTVADLYNVKGALCNDGKTHK